MVDHLKNSNYQLLITQEITKHLELVSHLLTNSRQSLIITGPDGIGKSTFLTILAEQNTDSWQYLVIQGNKSLNLENIQEHLFKESRYNKNKQTVLIIDDAGLLEVGLIDLLINHTLRNRFLRIIFVLTHDELDFKINVDKRIDDCYLIEIPPLTKNQWSDFLYLVAAQGRSKLELKDINDELIEATFLETQGVPGKIIVELPALDKSNQNNHSLKILIGAVIVLIILALLTQWLSQNHSGQLERASLSIQDPNTETPKE